jgi:hypothetical protein
MSETARALGLPGEVVWQGRPLKVSRVTFEIEGLFERWLEARAYESLRRNEALMGPAMFVAALRVVQQDIVAGDYAWTGAAGVRAAWTPAGFRELSFYCVAKHQHDWDRAQHDDLLADGEKYAEIMSVVHNITEPLKNGSPPEAPATGGNS